MTPKRSEPWWHAHTGLLVTLALTATGAFVMVKVQLASLEAKATVTDSLERRIAALEALCREK